MQIFCGLQNYEKQVLSKNLREIKELLLDMELSTHLMLKMSGMSTKILHVHEE